VIRNEYWKLKVRWWKNFKKNKRASLILASMMVLALFALALPWPLALFQNNTVKLFDIPLGYFLMTLLFPLAMLLLTIWFSRLATSIDLYARDTENE